MNRLIIIGNGFDLAHGLKTSYHDFILDYLKESVVNSFNDLRSNPKNFLNQYYYFSDELIEIKNETLDKYNLIVLLGKIETVAQFKTFAFEQRIKINFHFKIIEIGFNKLSEFKWVDFEIEYFKELLDINSVNLNTESKEKNNERKLIFIKELNTRFEIFKSKLENYLRKQEAAFYHGFDRKMLIDCFCEKILSSEVDIIQIADHFPRQMLFLNFNYTNTLEPYLRDCSQRISSAINYIHGALSYDVGNPIFGFGDEVDKRYTEFENEANTELFKHIKTFEYLKSNNYSDLTRFLALEEFQVQIYGHSCGLSDRTMLKEIFEHSNCMSIKIFYHEKEKGINDYTERTYEIYRHFTDKNVMRNKVVNERYCRAMPQPVLGKKD